MRQHLAVFAMVGTLMGGLAWWEWLGTSSLHERIDGLEENQRAMREQQLEDHGLIVRLDERMNGVVNHLRGRGGLPAAFYAGYGVCR